ncbi:L-asparaginase 2-1 [Ophiocordyceps camponoti-floridani]|uniref:asparaginase n=1 Tax=Ophiocordyceps camponoti-floridani TaxID=2030778 RepID=A0A8H4Q0Y8_9HYPO|nr:L-asparaginase 2-1 [Ophiocordyceps camponoti-floridani]
MAARWTTLASSLSREIKGFGFHPARVKRFSLVSAAARRRRMCEEVFPPVGTPPKITVFGTGGTIAGSAVGGGQTTGYKPGVLSVEGLIDAVPELDTVAELQSKQIINGGSPDITGVDLLRMAQTVNEELKGDTQGVVITHGTDAMEESAFCLELTVESPKPVVLVGAMRPATAHGADGPMNLLCAVRLAACMRARRRGVMIVLNDRICSAHFTTKTHANSLDSFKAEEQGYLGMFVNSQPHFYYPACRPLNRWHFDVSGRNPDDGLPQVDVLYGHPDMNQELFRTAVETSQGVVLAAMGGGCWGTKAGELVASAARDRGFPVVVSRRMASGFVGGAANYGLGDSCIGGGLLDANRCRIQLQLALAMGLDRRAIRRVFEGNKSVDG